MSSPEAASTYDLYGLRVRSDLPLPGATALEHDAPADVTIETTATAPVPREVPAGEVLALWRSPAEFWHGVVRGADGVRFRVPEVVEYVLTGDRGRPGPGSTTATGAPGRIHRHVAVTLEDEGRQGLAEVLASGALFAVLFELAGTPILHAGAVEVDGRAVAVVGHSGRGKSTTSALLCRAGLPLVTDDLLRLRLGDGEVRCSRGTTSLRLRDKARRLVESFGGPVATSADGRLLLAPAPTKHRDLPLSVMVFPVPTRDGDERIAARKLSTTEAFDEVLAAPRFLGWEHPSVLSRLFATASDLARTVPAYEVRVPWAETFPDHVVEQLADVVRTVAEQPDGP